MATLATLTDRVEEILADTTNTLWSTATLTEAIRSALGEYNLGRETASQAGVTLSGLDGAGSTTLPALHDQVIVWGAAAYAALTRSMDRLESFQRGSEGSDLKAWGDQRLKEFKAMLGVIFPGYLVALGGSAGSGGMDPALVTAEVALKGAQASLAQAQAGKVTSEEALLAAQAALAAAQESLLTAQAGKAADERTLLLAQADKASAEAAVASAQAEAITGQEGRAAAAAAQEAADRTAEAARKDELRKSSNQAWGTWSSADGIEYGEGYDRS